MTEHIQYKTDPEFDIMVQPYYEESLCKLKHRLSEDESARIVHIWQDNYVMNSLVYNLISAQDLSFIVKKHMFAGKIQAALYVCLEQIKRTDLTSTYKRFLIGREFYYRNIMQRNSYPEATKTKCRLSTTVGLKYGVSGCSVSRYCAFSEYIMDIYSKDQELAIHILMERCRISLDNVKELSRLKDDEMHTIYKTVIASEIEKITLPFIKTELKQRYVPKDYPSQYHPSTPSKEKPPAIRQMPVYDPDAEVNSLCLTIGYWITSMQRVNNKVDFRRITTKARIQLMKELSFLENTIGSLQESLVERTDA